MGIMYLVRYIYVDITKGGHMQNENLKILIGLHRNVKELDSKTLAIAKNYGLSFSQFMVLEALFSKGKLSISEVRDEILSSVGTISLVVNNLEKMGYIKREADPNDKRICTLSLTDSGRKIISKIVPENEKMINDYMEKLDNEERKTLLKLLKNLGGKNDG